MGENITFSDWSEKLENGTNHWLPAYGFQQPSNLQDRQFEILNGDSDTQQTFLFLETILEETSDDLRSDSDYSGPTGWPDSDSDTSSVIHIAEKLNATLRNSEWGGSERDLVVPKKRRRRQLLNSDPGVYDDEDDDVMDDVTTVPMSRSSSLLQFETLERQCETVFKTTATSEPFAMASYSSNNYHWRFSSSDSLDDNRSTTDSSDEDLSRSYSSRSLKSNNSGLKSYRSFDSLTANQNKEADKSQSLLLSQSLSNNALYVEPEPSEPVPTPRGIYKTVECLTEMSCQHASKSQDTVRAKRSVENLSEDSGFGDHTSTVFPTGDFGSFSLFSAETDKETTDSRGDNMNESEDHATATAIATTCDDVKIEEVEEEREDATCELSRLSWQSAGEEEDCSESEVQCEPELSASMTSRVPVHSTPNLTYLTDSEQLFHTDSVSSLSKTYSLKRINFESESDLHASRTSVCSGRSSRVQITTSFVNLSSSTFDNGANNNNKVHFSPVVSEVKWDMNADTASREQIAKDYYSPSCVDAMVKKLFDCEEEEKEGHMDIKCVNVDANEDSVDSRPSCFTMESYQRAIECDEMKSPKHLSKFGEFFQRFSFKRLSGRSGHSKRKEEKKSVVSKKPSENSVNVNSAEDTKIIPNKPPLPPSSRRRPSPVFPQCTVSSSMSAEGSDRDGILETDLDSEITTKKAQSLLNLDDDRKPKSKKHPASTLTPHADYRAKSMEFLLDKENKEAVKFRKPTDDVDYPELAKEALTKVFQDAGISISQVQQVCCGYVYGDSTCGQRALYQIGMTGVPVFNVNNNCSTGSSALMLAKQFIESGSDCTLAFGFEKMERGSLGAKYQDRANPIEKHVEAMINIAGLDSSPITAQMFGNAGLEHMKLYGTKEEHFAKIAYKNHLHSTNNPYSQFQAKYTLEQIMKSPRIFGPLTKLQCCPTSDGAAAAILASEDFVRRYGLEANAVEIVGLEMATDTPSTFNSDSCIKLVGFDMTKAAADKVYAKTRVNPSDIDVIELHDCFSANELITYEALGLCPVGKAGEYIDSGANTYGGKHVVNPSGGLISKGHPLGATGLAQCAELCWQLRGEAGKRQVPNARLGLQHNLGLGGACIVGIYRLGFPSAHRPRAAHAQIRQNPVAASNIAEDPSIFKCNAMFKHLETAMNEDDENLVDGFRGVYAFEVRNGPGGKSGRWVINTKTGKGKITYNGSEKPEVTLIVNDVDIIDIISGKLDPQKAFFQNKLKVQGNMGIALKLTKLQKQAGAKIEMLRSKL